MAKIPDQQELEQRLGKVVEMIINGLTGAEVRQWVAEKSGWGIAPRTVYRYIAAAGRRVARAAEVHRQQAIGQAVSRYNRLYAKAWQAKDYAEARKVQHELSDLLGLPAPKRIEGRIDGNLDVTIRAQATRRQLDLIENDPDLSTRALELAELLALPAPRSAQAPAPATPAGAPETGGNGHGGNGRGSAASVEGAEDCDKDDTHGNGRHPEPDPRGIEYDDLADLDGLDEEDDE